jgi:heme exporter protein C
LAVRILKFAGVILVMYSIIWGLLGSVPRLPILNETIRNLYFHVTMWFTMIALLTASLVHSIRVLRSPTVGSADLAADSAARIAMVFASLGLVTGMLWARFTWGAFWVNDPKLNGTAVTMLVYLAYFILRGSVDDAHKRARLAAVYNIFAYVMMMVFIGVLPRLTDSLHPGNGGNPGFGGYDLDSNMRMVFYPAVLGWIFIGFWMLNLRIRIQQLRAQHES